MQLNYEASGQLNSAANVDDFKEEKHISKGTKVFVNKDYSNLMPAKKDPARLFKNESESIKQNIDCKFFEISPVHSEGLGLSQGTTLFNHKRCYSLLSLQALRVLEGIHVKRH